MAYSYLGQHVNTLGFGGLDADQVARLDSVVERARLSAIEARNAATNPIFQLWGRIIGAGSTVNAATSDAMAADNLYSVLRAKRDRLVADPSADENDVREVEGAVYAVDNSSLLATTDLVSPSGMATDVGTGIGRDIESLVDSVGNPLGVPLWVWGLGALALVVAVKLPRRR